MGCTEEQLPFSQHVGALVRAGMLVVLSSHDHSIVRVQLHKEKESCNSLYYMIHPKYTCDFFAGCAVRE